MGPYLRLIIINQTGSASSLIKACGTVKINPSAWDPVKLSGKTVDQVTTMLTVSTTRNENFTIYNYIIVDCPTDPELRDEIVSELILKFPRQRFIIITTSEVYSAENEHAQIVADMQGAVRIIRNKP